VGGGVKRVQGEGEDGKGVLNSVAGDSGIERKRTKLFKIRERLKGREGKKQQFLVEVLSGVLSPE